MDIERARYLTSEPGRAAFAAIPPEFARLEPGALSRALRKHHPPHEASALAEQLTLRPKAAERFGELAPSFLWTRETLEMATHPLIAAWRAERLARLAPVLIDLTTGAGSDLAALAATGATTLGLERDPVTTILAAHNVPGAHIARGDATRPPFGLTRAAIILDPSRRTAATRTARPSDYSPTYDEALALLPQATAGCLKTAPGIDHALVPPWAELEFVQLGRTLREAAIWAGRGATPALRRAVLLPEGATLDSRAPEASPEPVEPGAFLFDPESCVTRAGLVRHLAHQLDARLIDPRVAYLTAPSPAFHPMAATFGVLEQIPFSLARLRDLLRARHWRPDEIRRRAFPIEPDELRRLLGPLPGDPVTLLLTTIATRRTAFIARRLGHAWVRRP